MPEGSNPEAASSGTQLPGERNPNLDPSRLNESLLLQNLLAQQESGSFQGLMSEIRALDEQPKAGKEQKDVDEERKERLKSIEEGYQLLFYSTLEHHIFVSNECLEYRNPVATWASKPGRDVLQSFITYLEQEDLRIQIQEKSGGRVSTERKAWVKRMYSDFGWMKGSYAMQEGMGHLMKYYFSGPDGMINALYEQRMNPLARDFRWTNAKESVLDNPDPAKPEDSQVPELTLTKDQKEKTFGFSRSAEAPPSVPEKEGIRERSVRWQKNRFHFAVAVAEVGQIDWNNATRVRIDDQRWLVSDFGKQVYEMKLKPEETYLIIKLFGEGKPQDFNGKSVPEKILNWFIMKAKDKNKLQYRALMEALLLEDAREEIKRISSLGPDLEKVEALDALVERVKQRAGTLKLKEIGLSLEEKLARAVVRGGLVTDLGLGKSLKLGWGYEHGPQYFIRKKDGSLFKVSKDFVEKYPPSENKALYAKIEENGRDISFAGIHTGKDDYTPGWPFHHDLVYDRRASKRAGLILATSSNFREWAVQFPPTHWPDILWKAGGAYERDPELKKAIDYIFGRTKDGLDWQKKTGLGLNPDVVKILEKLGWGWGSAWVSKSITPTPDLPDSKGEASQHIIYASFIPREIQVLMFEQTLKLGAKDQHKIGMTFWEELMGGGVDAEGKLGEPKELDEVNYLEMQTDAFDRWHVNMNMMGRVLSTMVDPLKPDFEKAFFENPGGLKELLKRLYLGLRDESIKVNVSDDINKPDFVEVPGPLLWCIFASELISLYVSGKKDLLSINYTEGNAKTQFINAMQEWIKMELWMPGDIPGDFQDFGKTLATLTWFSSYQLNRIAKDNAGSNERETLDRAGAVVATI